MSEIKDTDWAYAAGFVDGEGCIAITRSFSAPRNRFYYGVCVVAVNRERAVLDWMKDYWAGWVVAMPHAGGNARRSWAWRSPKGTSAERFLRGIRPWLRIKGAQCENALKMIEVLKRSRYTLGRNALPADWLLDQENLYWQQRELNHRGSLEYEAKAMHSPRRIHRERLACN
ncbi:MAG TPA: hypothetical protein VGT01_00275 [Candidatus Dormibacteraeota bacterium]|nr:hypothetical protein [Candidatus Dormibacteraeota bacterium]